MEAKDNLREAEAKKAYSKPTLEQQGEVYPVGMGY